jgi:hypothetical protein
MEIEQRPGCKYSSPLVHKPTIKAQGFDEFASFFILPMMDKRNPTKIVLFYYEAKSLSSPLNM